MKLSVCIDSVFRNGPVEDALQTVKNTGYSSFEFWSWWDKDIDALKACARELDLEIATFCNKFYSLVDPTMRSQFLEGLEESAVVANHLECKRLITQVGSSIPGRSDEEQLESMVAGLTECLPMLRRHDITLLIEPLNTTVDHPGYFLARSDVAFQVVDTLHTPHIKVLYDIYHQQVTEGNLVATLTQNIDKIGHFHAAGVPGRGELYCGEIQYLHVLEAIRATGYSGYIGLEYFPKDAPAESLANTKARILPG